MLAALLGGCQSATVPDRAAPPTPLPLKTLFPADAIQALDHPATISAQQAAAQVPPNEEVMGVVVNGEARAYPIGLLSRHEVANDTLGGEPIAVTFCALCNSGVAVSRVVDDGGGARELHFGVSGKLLDDALVMVDRETQSLWAQSRLKAVEGTLAGQELTLLSSNQQPWGDWVAAHPDSSLVVAERPASAAVYTPPDFSLAGPAEEAAGQPRGYIFGVASPNAARAFPLEKVEAARVVNSELDGAAPFVLLALEEPGAVAAWKRVAAGQPLTFVMQDGTLRDQETGSVWEARSGVAQSGPLAGERLEPFPLLLTHWRGWQDLHPASEVWEGVGGGGRWKNGRWKMEDEGRKGRLCNRESTFGVATNPEYETI